MSETTRKKDNRIYGFDAIRAFSALYIMGYWHLRNYLSTATNVAMKTHIAYQMVYFCLAGFTFISGYLIYKHHKDSIKDFFLNRVLRIYPLYLLALASMTIYMFHRCIYYIAKKAAGTMTVPTAILTIFIIIVIAYLIQFIYDKICSVIITGRS